MNAIDDSRQYIDQLIASARENEREADELLEEAQRRLEQEAIRPVAANAFAQLFANLHLTAHRLKVNARYLRGIADRTKAEVQVALREGRERLSEPPQL